MTAMKIVIEKFYGCYNYTILCVFFSLYTLVFFGEIDAVLSLKKLSKKLRKEYSVVMHKLLITPGLRLLYITLSLGNLKC